MHLAKLFSQFYRTSGAAPRYNLLFVLHGAGSLHHVGLRHWLRLALPDALAAVAAGPVDFALCLEDLAQQLPHSTKAQQDSPPHTRAQRQKAQLYLHISKPANKDARAAAAYHLLQNTSDLLAQVDLVHRRVNLTAQYPRWPHELFSKRQIVAATVSSRAVSLHEWQTATLRAAEVVPVLPCSVLDNADALDFEQLRLTSITLAEALGRMLFPHLPADALLFTSGDAAAERAAAALDVEYLRSWVQTLSAQPRGVPLSLLPSTFTAAETMLGSLERAMSALLTDVSRSSASLQNDTALPRFHWSALPLAGSMSAAAAPAAQSKRSRLLPGLQSRVADVRRSRAQAGATDAHDSLLQQAQQQRAPAVEASLFYVRPATFDVCLLLLNVAALFGLHVLIAGVDSVHTLLRDISRALGRRSK